MNTPEDRLSPAPSTGLTKESAGVVQHEVPDRSTSDDSSVLSEEDFELDQGVGMGPCLLRRMGAQSPSQIFTPSDLDGLSIASGDDARATDVWNPLPNYQSEGFSYVLHFVQLRETGQENPDVLQLKEEIASCIRQKAFDSLAGHGLTPLLFAILMEWEDVVEAALLAGAPADVPFVPGACYGLLGDEFRVTIQMVNKDAHYAGWTPLHFAVVSGSEKMVRALLARDVRIDLGFVSDAEDQHQPAMKALLEGAQHRRAHQHMLFDAIKQCDQRIDRGAVTLESLSVTLGLLLEQARLQVAAGDAGVVEEQNVVWDAIKHTVLASPGVTQASLDLARAVLSAWAEARTAHYKSADDPVDSDDADAAEVWAATCRQLSRSTETTPEASTSPSSSRANSKESLFGDGSEHETDIQQKVRALHKQLSQHSLGDKASEDEVAGGMGIFVL